MGGIYGGELIHALFVGPIQFGFIGRFFRVISEEIDRGKKN